MAQFYRPAEAAFLPSVVPAHELVTANALNGVSLNVARLGGPPVGALLVALGGLHTVVIVEAASFLVAATTVVLMRSAHHDKRLPEPFVRHAPPEVQASQARRRPPAAGGSTQPEVLVAITSRH